MIRDEFERVAELGRGGNGTVYSARHRATGRMVAIKALLEQVGPYARERFLREAHVRLDSPYVVQVYEPRIEGEQAFIIMELMPGGSAQARVHQQGPLPIPAVLRVAEEITRALDTTHRAGLIHRDLKPANILFDAAGTAKLGDFGMAKDPGSQLTGTGQGMGTLAYVSPEQAEDAKHVDHRADLYSLGATLYHLLAGRPPFSPDDPGFVLQLIDEPPPPLKAARPDCPDDLAALVHRLLEKDPDDRPPHAASVLKRVIAMRQRYAG